MHRKCGGREREEDEGALKASAACCAHKHLGTDLKSLERLEEGRESPRY